MNLKIENPIRSARFPRKIYVASSWRNQFQPTVVDALRAAGHAVYDFRNPDPDRSGFSWYDLDPFWTEWTADEYVAALHNPIAQSAFTLDFDTMKWADTFVLVLPCGRSAHLELGWACGEGSKETIILTCDGQEPELMAKMCHHICTSLQQVLDILQP